MRALPLNRRRTALGTAAAVTIALVVGATSLIIGGAAPSRAVPDNAVAILWNDFCERKPETVECIQPTPSPTRSPVPTSSPTLVPTPTSSVAVSSVRVTSISALKTALADNTIREIIVADGTYSTTWIDNTYIRTAATSVLVRAETSGGVTFNLAGSDSPHISFRNGAAYQEWSGFKFSNSRPGNNGVIMFGEGDGRAVHHLTLRNIEFLSSISSGPGPNGNYQNGQGLYFSWSATGNHDILVDGFKSSAALWSQVHIYHDDQAGPGYGITIKNAQWILSRQPHAQMGIVAWSTKIRDYLFEDITISGANEYAIRHAVGGTMIFRRVTSTNSGKAGFYSSLGSNPAGITRENCSLS